MPHDDPVTPPDALGWLPVVREFMDRLDLHIIRGGGRDFPTGPPGPSDATDEIRDTVDARLVAAFLRSLGGSRERDMLTPVEAPAGNARTGEDARTAVLDTGLSEASQFHSIPLEPSNSDASSLPSSVLPAASPATDDASHLGAHILPSAIISQLPQQARDMLARLGVSLQGYINNFERLERAQRQADVLQRRYDELVEAENERMEEAKVEEEDRWARAGMLIELLEVVPSGLVRRLDLVMGMEGDGCAKCVVCLGGLMDSTEKREEGSEMDMKVEVVDPRDVDEAGQEAGPLPAQQPPCPIPPDTALSLPCTHTLHAGCLFPWLAMHTTCPVCRFDIDPESLALTKVRRRREGTPPADPSYEVSDIPAERKTYALPTGPQTLRDRVLLLEERFGLRCSDDYCIYGPTDADASFGGARPTFWLNADIPPCIHKFHSACLVRSCSLARAQSHRHGGRVHVRCSRCQFVCGSVDEGLWEEGEVEASL